MRFKVCSLLAILALAACETSPGGGVNVTGGGGSGSSQFGGPGSGGVSRGTLNDPGQTARPGSQEDLAAGPGDTVYFETDSHELGAKARQTLENQAGWLRRYPQVRIRVEGHTDERGTREYNLALADRRANSVKNYLVSLGISPSRISVISYGKERPVAIGSNESAWAQNRRAQTIVTDAAVSALEPSQTAPRG